jgi:hypothetical protein
MSHQTIVWADDRRSVALIWADGRRVIVYRVERASGPVWYRLDAPDIPYPTAATALGAIIRQHESPEKR